MLDADELAEMRALQVRAYGRDGELTAGEADRLAELQASVPERRETAPADRRESAGAERVATSSIETRGSRPAAPERASTESAPGSAPAEPAEPAEADEEPHPRASPLSSIRAFWLPLALAAVVVLAVGVGIGWLAFGRVILPSVALSPEQQEWQTALLAEGVYDSGSVRAVAAEDGVVVWMATQDEREKTCIILSDGERTRPSCQPTESVEEDGIFGQLVIEVGDDVRREIMASVFLAPSGEPAVRIDSWDQMNGRSSITYASEEETEIAAALAEDGFDPNSIWVAGYDRDVPVWTATDIDSQTQCLIYGGATSSSPRVCADPQTMTDQDSGLVLNVVDPLSGEATTFEMSPNTGPAYLVITRERGETGAGGD